MIDVVVYSKPGCCLCEEVKAKLKSLQASHAFAVREVNILQDPEAYQKFKEEVPVVLINGKKAFKFYLDEEKFLERLGSESG
jgi:glutaredoxin